MANVSYYQGPSVKYNATTYANGIYFSTNSQELFLNGVAYGTSSTNLTKLGYIDLNVKTTSSPSFASIYFTDYNNDATVLVDPVTENGITRLRIGSPIIVTGSATSSFAGFVSFANGAQGTRYIANNYVQIGETASTSSTLTNNSGDLLLGGKSVGLLEPITVTMGTISGSDTISFTVTILANQTITLGKVSAKIMEDEVGGIAYSNVWAGRTTSGTLTKGSSVSLTCSGGCSRRYSENGSTPDYRYTAESALHLVILVNGRYLRYCYDVAATN